MRATLFLAFFLSLTSFAKAPSQSLQPNPFPGSAYFVPSDGQKHPSVVMLHGSEGGSDAYVRITAAMLAADGYNVLALCYFDCGRGLTGPRGILKDVETTKVLDAVVWLRAQPQANGKVVVYGFSRGAELTMIAGSLVTTPANRPDALIAHSPSDTFNVAYTWDWNEPACWLCKKGAGNCPESAPDSDFFWNPSCGPNDPAKMDFSKSAWLIHGVNVPANTRIEIEKYAGPILITVGEKDTVWPVDQTRRIEVNLLKAGRHPEVHYFPGADHVFRGADEAQREQLVLDFLEKVAH